MNSVAFIPLRAGGKRIGLIDGKDKERADLGGHPLMAWTIRHAIDSGVFDKVIVVTRSPEHAAIAKDYGVENIIERPGYTVEDDSPDIDWVLYSLKQIDTPAIYSILRVTSPFRTEHHIRTANAMFWFATMDSLRMVTPVEQHPGKMWIKRDNVLLPLLPFDNNGIPWHSNATQTLPKVYIQTAGMEMARATMTLNTKSISGSQIMPYVVAGLPALDINTKFDWYKAEQFVKHGLAKLPMSLR